MKSGWINTHTHTARTTHTHFPFDQGSDTVQSLELNFCFSHFDLFVHILPSSFLSGKCQMPRARHCDRWSRGGQRRILSTRLSRSGGSCGRHAENRNQLKMLLTSQPTLFFPYVYHAHRRAHQTLFFLPAYLLPRRSLFSLQNKPKMSGEKERERSLVNDGERGDDLPRANVQTHARARAISNREANSSSFPTHSAPPIHPIFNSCFCCVFSCNPRLCEAELAWNPPNNKSNTRENGWWKIDSPVSDNLEQKRWATKNQHSLARTMHTIKRERESGNKST